MLKKDKSSNGQELLIAHIKELGADIMRVEGMIRAVEFAENSI